MRSRTLRRRDTGKPYTPRPGLCDTAARDARMAAWLQTMAWMALGAAVAVGVGALVLERLDAGASRAPWRCFWVGLVALLPLAAAWHLFLPLDGYAAAAGAALAAAGLARSHRALLAGAQRAARARPLAVFTWALLWAGLPWLALQPLTCVDGGLYYVAAVEWHRGFAQVPGLQATNPLSVMNSGAFHLLALAGSGPFAGLGHVTFNVTLAWWGVPLAVGALEGLLRRWSLPALAVALAAAPAVDFLGSDRLSCPSADVGVAWLGVGLAALVLAPGARSRLPLLPLVLLAPTFKLSLGPFAVVLAGVLLLLERPEPRVGAVARWGALGLLAALPSLAGNVVTSGYPFYPSTLGGLPVSAALPAPLVAEVAQVIRAYAAHDGFPGDATAGERALRLLLLNRGVVLPALLGACGLLALTLRAARRPEDRGRLGALAALGLVGWGTWFVSAPDPRFAGALLWWLGGLLLGAGLGGLRGEPRSRSAAPLLAVLAAVLLVGDLPFGSWPRGVAGELPTVPRNDPADLVTLVDGTTILDGTPVSSTPPRCWSVPCAALYPQGLRRRDAADVGRGFSLPPDARLPPLGMKWRDEPPPASGGD